MIHVAYSVVTLYWLNNLFVTHADDKLGTKFHISLIQNGLMIADISSIISKSG